MATLVIVPGRLDLDQIQRIHRGGEAIGIATDARACILASAAGSITRRWIRPSAPA